DIHSGNGFPPSVLGVGNGITNHVLEKDLENTASFFIYETTDSLDTTSSS
ncbi:hypothetical protein A2U01_0112659, partial [Trifolium medium]|nr:hypothetical protein [Trifolium medium]